MGKLFSEKVGNHYLYITSHCAIYSEPPHIHINKSKKTAERGAGKLWIDSNGSSRVQDRADATDRELKEIQDWIENNITVIQAEWLKLGGNWMWFSK